MKSNKNMIKLYNFAKNSGYSARINGGSVVVWDNDGFIQCKTINALKIWMGY